LVVLSGSIASAEGASVDAVTQCVHLSADRHYTYSYMVSERPTIGAVELECAVSDHLRKTVSKSQRTYAADGSTKPRWNRRCVVVDETSKYVFTRGDNAFSITRATQAFSRPVQIVGNAPCSQRAHDRVAVGGTQALGALATNRQR
jgi:hypothetical protein